MTVGNFIRIISISAILSLSVRAYPAQQSSGEALTPADFTNVVNADVGRPTWTPDGHAVAFTIQDPRKLSYRVDESVSHGGKDIWLADTRSGKVSRVTGGDDANSYFDPKWSPDGKYLAFLGMSEGLISLWVWDTASGMKPRKLYQSVNLYERGGTPFSWISNRRIVCAGLSPGEFPASYYEDMDVRAPQQIIAAWKQAWSRTPAKSVLDSPSVPTVSHGGTLLLLDVVSDRQDVIWKDIAYSPSSSPDGRYLAFFVATAPPHSDITTLARGRNTGMPVVSCVVVEQSGKLVLRTAATFDAWSSLVWSRNGDRLAFLASPNGSSQPGQQLFVTDVKHATTTVVGERPDGPFSELNWTTDTLLAVVDTRESKLSGTNATRYWVAVDDDGHVVTINAQHFAGPMTLLAPLDTDRVLGAADSQLWIVNSRSCSLTPFVVPGVKAIERVLVPEGDWRRSKIVPNVLIEESEEGRHGRWVRVDLATHNVFPLVRAPTSTAEPVSFSENGFVLFSTMEPWGASSAWLVPLSQGGVVTLFSDLNRRLKNVSLGQIELIKYRDLDGKEVGAELTLPPQYQSGRRYPLVVDVYPGRQFPPLEGSRSESFSQEEYQMLPQLLASHGYIVLRPSMAPTLLQDGNGTTPSHSVEPLEHLLAGVIPAIDQAIDLGYVDRERVGVMGSSYGGFATYALIGLTDRFKVAISISGASDFVSDYGTFFANERYTIESAWDETNHWWAENGQRNFGGPPWERTEAYIQNSPILYATRIHTPLLIIQGDFDYVPIQQGEEMYSALLRLNKRCRFVRYWTQGHKFDNPTSIRDKWQEIYDWLDQFLNPNQSNVNPN
jgi:dipeptidyl aminopeptidase/acylaminoacyl peptidase